MLIILVKRYHLGTEKVMYTQDKKLRGEKFMENNSKSSVVYQGKIPGRVKYSFAFGALGKDLIYGMIATFSMIYFTDIIKVAPAFIGTMFFVAKIWDAFNDLFMGMLVDNTRSRYGKFIPWLVVGTLINAFVFVIVFTDFHLTGVNLCIFASVIYVLWGMTYTIMDIPYWSFIPAITRPGKERENISSMARSCAGIGSAVPTVLTMVVVPLLGGGSAMADYRIGFKYWALAVAVIFVVSEVICCLNVKEKNEESVESHGIKEMFKSLLSNDQAIIVVIAIILINTSLYLTSNLVIYFFTYDIGDGEGAYSLFSAFGGASQIIAMMLFPLFRKKMEKKGVFRFAIIAEIAGYALLLAVTFSGIINVSINPSSWLLLLVPAFMIFAGSGLLNVLTTIFLSDTIEYGQMKNNRRDESVIFSMQTFVVKLASGFAALLAGIAISVIGLKTGNGMTAADQSLSAVIGLRFVMTVIPIGGLAVAAVIFMKKYILDENKMNEISQVLTDRQKMI
mgnify:CR=1 FL=1